MARCLLTRVSLTRTGRSPPFPPNIASLRESTCGHAILSVFVKKERLTSLVEPKVRVETGCGEEEVQMGVWDVRRRFWNYVELRAEELQAAEGQNGTRLHPAFSDQTAPPKPCSSA